MKVLKTERPKYFCRRCDEPVGEEDWCEGCANFVCAACDQRKLFLKPADHDLEDHAEADAL